MHPLRRISALLFAAALLPICLYPQAHTHAAKPAKSAAPAKDQLAESLRVLLADPALSHAQFGICVKTLDGQVLYRLQRWLALHPRFQRQALTTAAAYALLPVKTLTFTTNVVADGVIDPQGVLHGDIVLLGSGDPTLSRRVYPYRSPQSAPPTPQANAPAEPVKPIKDMDVLDLLAEQVEQSGVRSVEGSVIGDDSFYVDEPWGESWGWDDLQWSYGAPISALTFADNTIELTIAADPASPAATGPVGSQCGLLHAWKTPWSPPPPARPLTPASIAGPDRCSSAPGALRRPTDSTPAWPSKIPPSSPPPHSSRRSSAAASPSPATLSPATSPLSKPAALPISARSRCTSTLLTRTTVAAPLEERRVLATHVSIPLAQDITLTNKTSQNLHAELIFRLLGKTFGSDGSFAQASRVERQFLLDAGVNDADFFMYDGSGMSPTTASPPAPTLNCSATHRASPGAPPGATRCPVAGVDGTLSNRFKTSPLKGRLWAKTGTLNESNCLSGYLTGVSGKVLAFSIMVNGHRPGSDAELQAIDRIAEAIAAAE
jgi:D-alanyl-D-alanine carboxypeptidase/D-alanyl-D-alanine-endopeptidase (penicillin-binding protein 4)